MRSRDTWEKPALFKYFIQIQCWNLSSTAWRSHKCNFWFSSNYSHRHWPVFEPLSKSPSCFMIGERDKNLIEQICPLLHLFVTPCCAAGGSHCCWGECVCVCESWRVEHFFFLAFILYIIFFVCKVVNVSWCLYNIKLPNENSQQHCYNSES